MQRHPDQREPLEIDAALVRRLIAAQFPLWAALPVRPVEHQGWDNRTFRLGDDFAVRLPSASRYAAQVAKEQTWLPRLAFHLPLPIPVPLAVGEPAEGYPWRWSVVRWLAGETAAVVPVHDMARFATDLGEFLAALQRVETAGGPRAGRHSFWRGGPLATYDSETRQAVSTLASRIDSAGVREVWEAALASRWSGAPVWFHGDVAAGNLLVADGRLTAVIDFGCSGVGDPSCDLTIAWTLFDAESRQAFRRALPLAADFWARGRGWALWKALIVWAGAAGTNSLEAAASPRIVEAVLADHRAGAP